MIRSKHEVTPPPPLPLFSPTLQKSVAKAGFFVFVVFADLAVFFREIMK